VPPPIRAPFFEFGPKTSLDRAPLLEIVNAARAASARYDVPVILTPPALDIEAVKRAAPELWVFAQAMDIASARASTGAILARALAAAGADGVMLNHVERRLDERLLPDAVRQAHEAGLLTLLCADDVEQATRYARWSPTLILLEPPELIGTAHRDPRPWIGAADAAIAHVDPNVLVMHSGGIADEHDVRALIAQGAAGTGCSTAIVRAADPCDMTTRMIRAAREGWNDRNQTKEDPMAVSAVDAQGAAQ